MSSLKIGCATWSLGATPDIATYRKQLEAVAELGCVSVQLWAINEGFTPCMLDPAVGSDADRAEARRIADDLGLVVSGFCAQLKGIKGFGGMDEDEGIQERIDWTNRIVDVAGEWGVPVVTSHPGKIPEDTSDPAYQTLLRSLGAVAEHAASVGTCYALETGQETPVVMKAFLDDVGSTGIGVNYDPANLLKFGADEGTVGGVEVLKDHIVHTHAKDRNPDTGKATCGQGGVPWERYIAALKGIGYEGHCAIEDETGGTFEEKVESVRQSVEFLKQF